MPQRLRIATFNLESLDERPDLDPPFTARTAVLRPQLMRLDADVLCLQEVNGQHPPGGGPRRLLALDRLLDETPYAAFERLASGQISGAGAHAPPGQRGVDAVHNLVILSRYPIASSAELRHELVVPPVYRKTGVSCTSSTCTCARRWPPPSPGRSRTRLLGRASPAGPRAFFSLPSSAPDRRSRRAY